MLDCLVEARRPARRKKWGAQRSAEDKRVRHRKPELLAHLDEPRAFATEMLAQLGRRAIVNVVKVVERKLA